MNSQYLLTHAWDKMTSLGWCWARGLCGPFLRVAILPMGLWGRSWLRITDVQVSREPRAERVAFLPAGPHDLCASSPGSFGHRFPMLLDPALLLTENAEQALWPERRAEMFYFQVSCLSPQGKSFFFFFLLLLMAVFSYPLGEERLWTQLQTPGQGKPPLGKTQSQAFAGYLILSM